METEKISEKKYKILLGEDDKFISRAYVDGLSRAGHEVKAANDGNEVIKALEEFTPDIILLDIIMPEKNGFEVLEEIKANDKTKNIPVIVLSNLGQDTDIEKGKKLGAVDYLIKSNFSIKEVMNKIKSHLSDK